MPINVSMGSTAAADGKQPFVSEGRCNDLFDRVSQSFLTAEVMVERFFGDPGDGQNCVQACAPKTQSVHLAKTGPQQDFPGALRIP